MEVNEELVTEIGKVMHVVTRPALRRSFAHDPVGTLEREKVDLGIVPAEVVDVLATLSEKELKVLARVHSRFAEAGLTLGENGELRGGGRVSFF